MEVNRIVIHELKKSHMSIGAVLDLSSALLEIDDKAIQLISELNDRYNRLINTYAKFGNEEGNNFPEHFSNYYSNSNDDSFLEFTNNSISELKNKIENIHASKGGYLVYADYKKNKNFVGIYIIRNTEGVLFTKVGDKFLINPQFHVDFERMAMACRINKDTYNSDEERYLSFIKKRNEVTSDYFVRWICAEDKIDSKTDTRSLHNILNEIPRPTNPDGELFSKEKFLEDVYVYIKSNPQHTINLFTLSQHFYGTENTIVDYAIEKNIEINSEFKPDNTILRKFVNVKVKADEIELNFPAKKYNEIITVAPDNLSITIRSSALANKIRTEMNDDNESSNR